MREWSGERLKRTNEAAWKAAHSRLYDHLRDTTHEGKTPTLADLAPLYQAVAHGCRAGRRQAALVEVYISRICRLNLDGTPEFYSSKKLGAVSSNLAAIGWFFDRPYEAPSEALVRPARSFVVSQASIALRGQGRLGEALQATRASLRMTVEARDWSNAAADASNLIQTERLFGDVMAAVSTATIGAAYADRSPNQDHQLFLRADNADAFHAAGEWERAAALFADAERRQRERSLTYPLLHALAGYQYCDLLLSMGRAADARARAARTLEWARPRKEVLLMSQGTLTLGRADLAITLQSLAKCAAAESGSADARAAALRLDEAVEGMRAAGKNELVPRGLLARAAFRRAVGDWDGAARDLDEAQEIAEPGPMRLFLSDIVLERARLALARLEAFAPLNKLVEPSPPPPALPNADEAAALKDDSLKQLDAARKLISTCGYHRRDKELAELDDVVAGRRRFADLPPRV